MTVLFGRQYELIIGDPVAVNKRVIARQNATAATTLYQQPAISPASEQFSKQTYDNMPIDWFKITDLDMTADINQSNKGTGEVCTITVTNLPTQYLDQLTKDKLVIFRAKYRQQLGNIVSTSVGEGEDEWPDLFVGQIVKSTSEQRTTDRVTTIKCGEAITVRKNVKISYAWPPQTTRKQVIEDMLTMLQGKGVASGWRIMPIPNSLEEERLNKPLFAGYSVKGFLLDELEKMCESVGFRVFTLKGKVWVEQETVTLPVVGTEGVSARPDAKADITLEEIYYIVPSQVKGKVQPISDNTGQMSATPNKNETNNGVTFSVWLNGNISPDKYVDLKGFPDNYDGLYKVSKVKHSLHYRSTTRWDTRVTAERIQ